MKSDRVEPDQMPSSFASDLAPNSLILTFLIHVILRKNESLLKQISFGPLQMSVPVRSIRFNIRNRENL